MKDKELQKWLLNKLLLLNIFFAIQVLAGIFVLSFSHIINFDSISINVLCGGLIVIPASAMAAEMGIYSRAITKINFDKKEVKK